MTRKEKLRKWLWIFSFPAAAVLLFKLYDNFDAAIGLIGQLIGILSPFVGGFVLAFLLFAPSRWMEERFSRLSAPAWKKLARPVSILITYLCFLGLLVLVFSLVMPVLVDSLTDLVVDLPTYLETAQKNINRWLAPGGPLGFLGMQDKINGIYENMINASTGAITAENVLVAIKGVGSVATSLINVLIAFVVSIYMLSGREHLCLAMRNFLGLFLRRRPLATLRNYAFRTGHIFSRYIYGATLDALVVGVVVSIGLLLFDVPYAVLLGMTLGVMNLIPYFGAIIGCIGIAFITLLTNGLPTAIGVAVYIVVFQQIDANIIQPRIVGDTMGLRPFYVLLSITFFGGIFGFWGILLGPPLMAVVQMVVRDIYSRREKQKKKALVTNEGERE